MTVPVGYRTLYELVAQSGERTIFLGYTNRRGNARSLVSFLNEHPASMAESRLRTLARLVGENPADAVLADRAADGAVLGPWRIRWSGRTQRSVETLGEPVESIYAA